MRRRVRVEQSPVARVGRVVGGKHAFHAQFLRGRALRRADRRDRREVAQHDAFADEADRDDREGAATAPAACFSRAEADTRT
ncbi:hypothetical protein WS95_31515 [Burkholderia sp. MSMB1826]|nr:hypothetical protein WS95_31515 [Burkholderia sp. MSMB1826]